MMRNRRALLTALAVDNLGSGLFLPLSLLYVTRVVRLPLATAGTVVALGTLAGLAVPPVAGRLVDRAGPRLVVICAQLLQALGAVTYLAARGAAVVVVAAVLLAVGQQTFYSSLFGLISDVAGDGPKDRPFAVAAMVRSACFGLGGLAAGGLLSTAGPVAYRIAVLADAASFAACALLLALLVRIARRGHHGAPAARDVPRVLSDALAEALAPRAARGRYLAAFQYAFTVPGVIAPAVVALFSVAVWLPWLLVGAGAALAAATLGRLAGRLPADALRLGSVAPPQVAVR